MAFLTEAANRGSISTGYEITNSCKFERDNSEAILTQNQAAGDQKTWTFSAWVKRSRLNFDWDNIFGAGTAIILFNAENDLIVELYNGTTYKLITDRVFRDLHAWYHLVVVVDTTEGTASNRVKIYVNGIQETSLSTATYPPQNATFPLGGQGSSTNWIQLGRFYSGARHFSGYMADVYYLNGTAEDADAFGEFDEDSNIWKPKAYTGSGYGTQGFHYKFDDSSNMGKDSSGEGHDANNLANVSAANQATDSPTNNFPVLVPMYAYSGSSVTISEGGLECDINMPSNSAFNPNTSAMSSFQMSGTDGGKWYMESKITSNNRAFVGIVSSLAFLQQTVDPTEFVYWDFYNGWIGSSLISTETNPPDAAVNTIIGMAIDCDNQRVTFSKNGGWLEGSGNMNGSTPSDWRWDWTSDANFLTHPNCNGNVAFWCGIADNNNVWRPIHQVNFGGFSPYTISSGNADENGYGNFEYAVPSGFYALCTKNLAEYG